MKLPTLISNGMLKIPMMMILQKDLSWLQILLWRERITKSEWRNKNRWESKLKKRYFLDFIIPETNVKSMHGNFVIVSTKYSQITINYSALYDTNNILCTHYVLLYSPIWSCNLITQQFLFLSYSNIKTHLHHQRTNPCSSWDLERHHWTHRALHTHNAAHRL